MSKKTKLSFLMILTFCLVIFTGIAASATTAPTTATISVAVTQDDSAKTAVSGLTATITDAAGTALGVTPDTSVAGTYTFANLASKGTYYVTLTKSSNKLTIPVAVTSFGTKAVSAVWVESGKLTANKSGVLGGLALDSSNKPLAAVTVKAYNSAGYTWETVSDTNGAYKLYLPSGKYTLVVVGSDDTNNDYKNVATDVTVAAGQMSGPMADQNAQTAWGGSNSLGLTTTTLASDSKDIKGVANSECLVSAYIATVDTNNKITGYTYLASAKAAKATTGATGAYDIKLPDYQMGNTIAVRVIDKALNTYEIPTAIPARTMTLTAADSTKATVVNDVNVTIADSKATTMNTYLTSNVTSVAVKNGSTDVPLTLKDKNGGTSGVTLKNSDPTKSDYKVAGGKITFKAGVLSAAATYTITVKANGYNDGTVTQTVGGSTTTAPGLTGTYTVAPGSVVGSTKFTAIGTAGTNNKLQYEVVAAATTTPKAEYKGNKLVGGTAVDTTSDIKGVDPTTNKYIDVYETTSSDIVVATKRITLVAANILAPSITKADITDKTLTLTSDTALNATAPATAAFVVKVGGVNVAVSAVAISGKSVTLTLASAPLGGTTVTVDYTAPATNALKEAGGNAVATFKAMAVGNHNTAAGNLTATASKGTATGTTAVAIPTVGTGNSIVYKVSNATIATPNVGDVIAGTTAYTTIGADISGVSTTNKYLAIYEIDGSGKVVNFKLITLDATVIK